MSQRRGKIRSAYKSAYPDPLIAAAGEILALEDRETEWPGWIWGVHPQGRAGWVPDAYLQRDGNRGVLVRDYDATELTVEVGEELTALSEHGGWLRCRTDGGGLGWVPAAHVALASGPAVSGAGSDPHPQPGQGRLKEALLASDEAYRALVDQAVQGLFISQGFPPRIVFANETFERIIGYTFET